MRVKVRLFAGLRERAGIAERELEDVARLDDVWPALGLGEEPLSLDALAARVRDPRAGAVVTFSGVTREVERLEYEAYVEMAEDVMAQLARSLGQRYDIWAVAIHHRVGRVEVGEASVAIAVSAPHRQDALAACKDAIDELKERVPLWKKEVYEGGEEWIGRGS